MIPDPVDYGALVARALDASPAEHLAARDSLACPICGAAPAAECIYGALAGRPTGRNFPGRVHARRLVRWLQLPCNTES